mmetsp:Transcript_33264/g.93259  ORF Transcript_33264/g.93259 Transcript_33264/m.93259 type:complete len:478 (+) Transcript_33264:133-1566(+)|eukprot:CAMPEP_0119120734 /NCGR_PEP_ID=MMETSP1310-20130426/1649_1 /TAXON_ID=464262 /ORGANISM="Genus nov. species nov., Strain RCC2339" /LENGTH=477 /DNA_ID=CAMNT_0007110235 /DNA_START=117 /DNA_END=1550 /DNA_ORIENTATION=+
MDQVLARLEQICNRLEAVEAKVGGGADAPAPVAEGEQSAAAKAWDDLVASYWAPFAATTNAIGGDVLKQQLAQFNEGNCEVSKVINTAAQCKKPAVNDLKNVVAPLAAVMKNIKELRESNRRDKQWEHLSTLSEACAYFNWVVVEPTPAPFTKESLDASLFWSNKILKLYKGKEQQQVDWCNQLKEFFQEVQKYIKQYHTTGLTWNKNGKDVSAVAAAPAAAPAAGGPPPPGPPPPPSAESLKAASSKPSKAPADTNALFAQLNQGGNVTKGLKKVTRDMQTHKNPGLRAGGVVKEQPKKAAAKPKPKFGGAAKKMDPKGPVLEGNKWVIEFHNDNQEISIPEDEIETKHSVYIYKCERCTINIPSKVNSVIMDTCKRTGVAFKAVISGCEIVNSGSVKVQAQGKIPNFAIDKCSSIQVILSKESLDAQVVTSKCDSVNVMFPKDDDYVELPIVEQFVSTIDAASGKITTVPMEHEG